MHFDRLHPIPPSFNPLPLPPGTTNPIFFLWLYLLIQQAKLFSGIHETVDSWYTTWWVSISIHFKTITAVSLVPIMQRYYIIIDSILYTVHFILWFFFLSKWKFVPLNLLHLLLSSPHPPPFWQPSVCSLYIYDSALVLLCLFICPQKSEIIQYLPFSV